MRITGNQNEVINLKVTNRNLSFREKNDNLKTTLEQNISIKTNDLFCFKAGEHVSLKILVLFFFFMFDFLKIV